MFIADRNVYGIDLNPVAVELAEVSLWLNTIYEGGFVPWFGTQLVNGNSLIGARRQVYRIENAQSTSKGLRWYEMEPDRVPLGTKRMPKKQVYHFLLGDPGMCSYTDKVIKQLEPANIKEMKDWNKKFTSPFTDDEVVTLLRLSAVIDELWEAQIQLRKEVGSKTQDALSIFGYTDDAEDSHTTIRQKDKIFSELYKSEHMKNAGPYARLKFAMDYWCALWFWPIDKADLLPTRSEFLFDMSLILEGTMASVNVTDSVKGGQLSLFPTEMEQMAMDIIDTYGTDTIVDIPRLRKENPRLDLAARIAEQNKFMHWELEFADLFTERGGFDLIIGNPPWIKIEWNEQSVLSDTHPMFAVKKLTATQTTHKRAEALENAVTRKMYFSEYEMLSGEQAFLNAVQNYADLKGQQTNLFKCFLPQSWMYNSKSGVAAFVHPEGVYDDPKGGALREKLYPRLRYHFQFANERKLFPEVDHHTQFSLNVYGGPLMVSFDTISNLYDAKSIVECYEGDAAAPIPGIKDEDGDWNVKGHPDRVIHVTKKELAVLVDVDEDHDISSAYRMDNEDFPFGYEFVRKATLREINFGESDMTGEKLSVSGVEEVRKGFRICKYCGKIQPENGKANHSFACKTNKVDDRSFDGLRVATMHRVKGLEFKYVFIAAVNNRIIPLPFAINKTDAVSEVESITSEKCLLYVAMTRAQKGVYITSYGRPSEFLV